MKIQVGLGVLSIPSAFDALGLIPGIICLAAVGMSTTWCAWVVGSFKLRHPEIYGVDDAVGMILGPIGRETLALAFTLCKSYKARSQPAKVLVPFINSYLLACSSSPHLRFWFWYARHVDCFQRPLNPRSMHGDLCRRCGRSCYCMRIYPNPPPSELASLGRRGVVTHRK